MKMRDFAIEPGKEVNLAALDPSDTGAFKDKDAAARVLAEDLTSLIDLQDRLSAQRQAGILLVLQGMDSAGKDGVIKHVMSGINPQGVDVYSFKQPSDEEHRHDYLWRAFKVLPERGRIAIFNRSYYEDVIVTRVHPELLGQFRERERSEGAAFWRERFRDINRFEEYLTHNAIYPIKIFLNLSRKEQKKRLLKRLDDPGKHWKFSMSDVQQRSYWDDYMRVYADTLAATSTKAAPWYVVPADHKWFARTTVANIVVKRLRELKPEYPKDTRELRENLAQQRAQLENE